MATALAVRPVSLALVEGNDGAAAARAAGLRHVDDRRPGLRRRRTGKKLRQGKRWVEQFQILGADGRRVRDAETLERIRKLAIPPAWEEVWICPHPSGHIQATGRDARGRKQYRYHPRWREHRDQTKYSKMIAFAGALPALRRQLAADLRLPGLSRRKVLATVVTLLEASFIRVGNEEYARANHSFGLTTLQDRHVAFGRGAVRFHFRGKSGVFHEVAIHDAAIARIVRRCRDLPGQELFQYLDENGRPASIDSADVNDYIREIAGQEFTAKDFRTWAGTVLAAVALCESAAAASATGNDNHARRARRSARRPSKRDVVRAIERVAQRLGNTPSVCRKSYIHPEVIGAFIDQDGAFGPDGILGRALAQVGAHAAAENLLTLRPRGNRNLDPEEAAVLALLKRRQGETRRGNRLETQLRRSLRAVRQAS